MAGGGFGTGWGATGWGGALASDSGLLFETITLSESLTVWLPLSVISAVPLSPYIVVVHFSHDLDLGYGPNFDPSNYSTVPSLTIVGADPGPTANTVRLQTLEQVATTYTLSVSDAHSATGDALNPAAKTALFAGFAVAPTYFATAQSQSKVMLTFSTGMLENAAIADTASYIVEDFAGTTKSVTSVTLNRPAGDPVYWVTLELGDDLDPGGYYIVTIDPAIKASNGLSITPRTDVFQWEARDLDQPIGMVISDFSGEVSSGLLGQPLGQVFFSPALDSAVSASSSIQIDEIAVCTRAYDTYTFPPLPDPEPLMVYGGFGLTTLGNNVLWAPAPRLGLATFHQVDTREDTMPTAVDGPADATLQETFDQSKVALLNVGDWVLFDGVGTSFICADNLAPVGPGATTNINLQP